MNQGLRDSLRTYSLGLSMSKQPKTARIPHIFTKKNNRNPQRNEERYKLNRTLCHAAVERELIECDPVLCFSYIFKP